MNDINFCPTVGSYLRIQNFLKFYKHYIKHYVYEIYNNVKYDYFVLLILLYIFLLHTNFIIY